MRDLLFALAGTGVIVSLCVAGVAADTPLGPHRTRLRRLAWIGLAATACLAAALAFIIRPA